MKYLTLSINEIDENIVDTNVSKVSQYIQIFTYSITNTRKIRKI